jgi:hypothetical protein
MIERMREIAAQLRESIRQARRALGPSHGQHAGRDHYESIRLPATLAAPPAVEQLSAPRVAAQRLTWPERVKLAYEYAEYEMVQRLNAVAENSAQNWRAIYG